MKKINILKENTDFDRIIKKNNSFKTKYYYIYVEKNEEQKIHKFGISVSKKIGNAVTRNLYKRRIKTIIDKNIYKNNFNCIIILRKSVLESNFQDLEKELNYSLKKLNLLKEL